MDESKAKEALRRVYELEKKFRKLVERIDELEGRLLLDNGIDEADLKIDEMDDMSNLEDINKNE